MKDFDESKHPRAEDGKFTEKGGGSVGRATTITEAQDNLRKSQGQTLEEQIDDLKRKKEQAKARAREEQKSLSKIHPEKNAETFHSTLSKAKESQPPEYKWRVDLHDLEDYKNDKLFLSKGGSCIAVEPNGNIISVCWNVGDETRGHHLLKIAVDNGGDRLDAFGEFLFGFYTRNGFEPVSWTEFDEQYKPAGWKREYGKEPVIFYKYTGKQTKTSYEEFLQNTKASQDYDTAYKQRDESIRRK